MSGPLEQRISRRAALAGAGSVGLGALLAACGADDGGGTTTSVETTTGAEATVQPKSGKNLAALFGDDSACTLTAEDTEGPYYFDANSIRSDITEDRDGVPLRLALRVRGAGVCEPLENAVVDIWHADAGGVYSGFESQSAAAGGESPDGSEKFLRGAQVTDSDGIVQFKTIYPGWYQGRTVHLHAKVHLDNATVLTTQLYLDDEVSDAVFTRDPYASRGSRETTNGDDFIFDESLVVPLGEEGDGYLGAISLDVKPA